MKGSNGKVLSNRRRTNGPIEQGQNLYTKAGIFRRTGSPCEKVPTKRRDSGGKFEIALCLNRINVEKKIVVF